MENTLKILGSFSGATAAINHRYKKSRSSSHRLSYPIHDQSPYPVHLLFHLRKQASDASFCISSCPAVPRRESLPMTAFRYLHVSRTRSCCLLAREMFSALVPRVVSGNTLVKVAGVAEVEKTRPGG
ncbi:hypothetical protein GMOD_00006742 [Pyrenophora seminiperda CCB06]|uniref:Uncharacterized protein n=1 Tax=Pyrenophora seminiperda CCB06 TaxID=1302712 RepID=A0A3M7MB49_9PLEO|nr:hypothetical protein GMOD_00006742 [Pyrenophora seminiperda CCB06]